MIAIPARYGSTRFPGKPLAKISGKSMLERVVDIARDITRGDLEAGFFVTTEDKRIEAHAKEIGAECIITPPSCPTGSDRILAALRQMDVWPDIIVNLQGDAPFTPPEIIQSIFDAFEQNPHYEVVTPVHRLSWIDLDRLRENKRTTPFSGTTAIVNNKGRALWFSKNIIPAIRDEESLRQEEDFSPVYQHIGLYGFRSDILEKYCMLPQGTYENYEGLEQLRMIENDIKIHTVLANIPIGDIQSGIDTPDDLARAESRLLTLQEKAS
ncbi:MAG: 3-deoxy-manno-octulosonate cytidylyltransferase [Alphaproteobacteria bacterium]|nr:3-deoxy-manno-octulosonate cytidylyltransferase [Alphaproteobacteria bacterium]